MDNDELQVMTKLYRYELLLFLVIKKLWSLLEEKHTPPTVGEEQVKIYIYT